MIDNIFKNIPTIIVLLFLLIFTSYGTVKYFKSNKKCKNCQLNCNKNQKITNLAMNKTKKKANTTTVSFCERRNELTMEDANKCIACTVSDCKNHCKDKDYCKLNSIIVEAHKNNPQDCENIDCKSFERNF